MKNKCKWKKGREYEQDVYYTDCDNIHLFDEGDIKQNNYSFCPYCGGEIEEVAEDSEE